VRAISAFQIDSELRLLFGRIMTGDEHRESQQFVNGIFAIPLSKSGLTRVTPNRNSHRYKDRREFWPEVDTYVNLSSRTLYSSSPPSAVTGTLELFRANWFQL
jgi:hypothetical protein